FPGDEHGRWRWRSLGNGVNDCTDRLAVPDDLPAILPLSDFTEQIGSFLLELAQAVFRCNLVLYIAENQAVPTASMHIKAGNARFGSKCRGIRTDGVEPP